MISTWIFNVSFSYACGPLSWYVLTTLLSQPLPPTTIIQGAVKSYTNNALLFSPRRIIPAEIFDTHTRSKGVSIATMTSFAFNTLIGQVTEIAVDAVGWRYFLLFAVANLTNAVFFYLILPETKRLPLEEMNYLFTHAPWIIARADPASYRANLAADVERRAEEIREKGEL